ncbi:MAG: HlyD family efflux transporter periplasmic adaptor subunit [Muribaculaceae bacterium]|nr:HlyD family efflux transporter periplasmic adaptor subunit [Muribaculaceae bacterium]
MLILTIVVVILILAGLAILGFLVIKQGPDTVQGQADATEIRISGKLPGRVEEIFVEEGDRVKKGDTLVHIHSSLVDARLGQAEAMESAAQAANAKVDAGTRSQIVKAAYELWQQALAAEGIAKKTYDRMEALYAKGVISEQKRDEAKAAYQAATAGVAAAESQYSLAKAGAQKEDKEAAAAMVNVAKGGVNEVTALLEDQYLVAPYDGEITEIYPNVSELVATGAPIMSLQKDDHWVVFNVRETLLKDITTGTVLKIRIPALDIVTDAKVFYIKDLGTYANWQATKSTGDYDARTFQVKAKPTEKIENLRPGMSVILENHK